MRFTIVVGSLAAAAAAILWYVGRAAPATYPKADQAVLELYTRYAAEGSLLVGPYSRFQWHHPGPLYFYLLAPFYVVGSQSELALYVAALVINLTAIVAIVWLVARHSGAMAGLLVAALLAAYVFRAQYLLVSPWNPHIPVIPLALLIVACAAAIDGQLSATIAVVAVASFVAQTHVAFAPCAAALAIVTAVSIAARERASMKWLIVAAVVACALWAPPLVEEIRGAPGNITLMRRFLLSPAPSAGDWTHAWPIFETLLSAPFVPGRGMAIDGRFMAASGPAASLIAAVQMAVLPLAWEMARRQRRRFEQALAMFCLVASGVALWSVTRVPGEVFSYLVFWVSIIGVLDVAAIGLVLVPRSSRFKTVAGGMIAAVCAALMAYGVAGVAREFGRSARTGADVRRLSLAVENYVRALQLRPLIRISEPTWPHAAGVILQLDKHGLRPAVENSWVPMFGRQMGAAGGENGELQFADPELADSLARRDDYVRVERFGDVFVFAKRPPRRPSA